MRATACASQLGVHGGFPMQQRSDAYPECVAEQLHVVKAQGRDAAHHWRRNAVGGIQSASQANFQDRHIHFFVQKHFQACSGPACWDM